MQIFQQQSIALVILDMNMPGMNGEQTYEKPYDVDTLLNAVQAKFAMA